MNLKNLLTGIVCLVGFYCTAQYDNNWYFGRWAGINFTTGSPAALTNNMQSAVEGTAAISDKNGQLLFYTNGVSVFNRNNTLMINGGGLAGGTSSTQAAIIIPHPGNNLHYYIFTTDDEGTGGLNYSEVNMAADSGLGAIAAKNIPLITPVCEKIAATYHANGTDIWVTVHHWGSNAFYSYLVTAAGVTVTPVISYAGAVTAGLSHSGRYAGSMAVSPDGSHIAVANVNIGAELFDFDSASGIVSNPVTIRTTMESNGIEFSASGNMLYLSADKKIFQYRINAPDVAATELAVATTEINAALKLGPDSKIYFIRKVLADSLSVINNPDAPGLTCNVAYAAIDLAGRAVFTGLPAFLKSPFYLLDIATDSNCTGTAITFWANATRGVDSIEWDFGDGSTAKALLATHTYAAAGTYTVKLKAGKGSLSRYFSKKVVIVATPTATQPADMIACGDENDQAVFTIRAQASSILGPEQATGYTLTFYESEADAVEGSNQLPDNYTNSTNPQVIFARVSTAAGICHAITSFNIRTVHSPVITLPHTYYFCEDSTVTLTAPDGFDDYIWSDGIQQIHAQSIIADAERSYTLTVVKNYQDIVCTTHKEINVKMSAKPQITAINTDEWTDDSNSITVSASGGGNYLYSIDGTSWQDSNEFNNLKPGRYTVHVKDVNGCGKVSETVVLLMYPRFFTPNGDGENEVWKVNYAYFEPGILVHIFDRYGKPVYSFNGNAAGWDGTFNGSQLPATDYWFIVERKDGKSYKGHFSMIR